MLILLYELIYRSNIQLYYIIVYMIYYYGNIFEQKCSKIQMAMIGGQ